MLGVSAVICTYNRSNLLPRAITSLLKQTAPTDRYEILIIDNCSTDDTKNIVQQMQLEYPKLRYISEPNLGLSNARNRGWLEAKFDLVGYLDDDAEATENWIEEILRVAENSTNTLGVVGGKVLPNWQKPPPKWITKDLHGLLSLLDWGDNFRIISNSEYLCGANSAYTKQYLKTIGGFSNKLGRIGASLLSGEESLLNKKIGEKGLKVLYNPEMVIYHFIPDNRMKIGWILNRAFWGGISQQIIDLIESPSSRLFRLCLSIKKLLGGLKSIFLSLIGFGSKSRVAHLVDASKKIGQARVLLGNY